MYKHVIWDFDGTLFDTYPVMGKTFQDRLKEYGIDEPMDEILKHMKVSMTHTIHHYKEKYQIDSAFIEKYEKQRKELEFQLSKPYEVIKEICEYIATSKRHNYLYTHRGDSAIQLLKIHGLYDYFSDFITKRHGFERKPSPDAINYLVDKHRMVRNEAIMIGDREIDILSGKNAHIAACYFTDSDEKSETADYTIHSFQELYSIL
ncbi:MAG: HAD-IA family hydrolase [Tuberibacillus sp.]